MDADIVIMNEALQIVCIVGAVRDERFLAGANEQHKSIVGALRAAAGEVEI